MFFNKSTDLVQIIAPSSPAKAEDYTLIITKISEYFRAASVNFIFNTELNQVYQLPYYANTPEFRANDLMSALTNDQVKIIWTLRGGSSANTIMDHLDLSFRPTQLKTLIGFSDITSLHILFNQYYNIPTIHGATVKSIVERAQPSIIDDYLEILNTAKPIQYHLIPLNKQQESLQITSLIYGGNLKVITSLIGTKLQPNFSNAILIIEDVEEQAYAIMRDLVHLQQAGLFTAVNSIIFGDFLINNNYCNLIDETIDYFATNTQIPCYRMRNFGHGINNNPVILKAQAIIENNILSIYNPFSKS